MDIQENLPRLIYLCLLLVFVVWAFSGMRQKLSKSVRDLALWALIIGMLVIAYGFRDTLKRELMPGSATWSDMDSITLSRGPGRHFRATVDVNGVGIPFIVDTGATGIVLSLEDAERIGIDPDTLVFSGRASTANGVVETAPVRLETIEFGPFSDTNVRAHVNGGRLDDSLLGMSYLNRFSKLEIAGDRMILHR
ncbi:retropepsin-like aspartic protease family protein [Amaricoccus tamworthensis]|uniref:retropepsin-like aspartic protease family protein n=1 Tax=Amaricoccus tamworthensis TaxID=57002 RepID=UPI003C7A1E09